MAANIPLRIAIAAILKNEAPYILEWVAYHRVVGVDRFFVADNDSDDGSTQLLAALDAASVISHIPFPNVPNKPPQLAAYAEIMRRHNGDADWIAFVDADEFLLPTGEDRSMRPVVEEMNRRPGVGAVAVNWATYGSSGHKRATPDLVIERFSLRAEKEWSENFHYKSIVRTKAWQSCYGNPHLFNLKDGWRAVHSTGEEVVDHPGRGPGLSREHIWERLRLNHYVVKSKQEFFERKQPKGRATVVGGTKGAGHFVAHDRNETSDPMPTWLVDATKAEMARLSRLLGGRFKRSTRLIRKGWDQARAFLGGPPTAPQDDRPPTNRRIFLIGPNKCGTTSFHRLFTSSGVRSVHFEYVQGETRKNLAQRMVSNISIGESIIHGLTQFQAFSDMSYTDTKLHIDGAMLYRLIHRELPSDYFILNTRNVDGWIRSRFLHNKGTLATRQMKLYECTKDELEVLWRKQFKEHHQDVVSYFSSTTDKFILYNIEDDKPDKLKDFLSLDFDIDIAHWGRTHLTK